MKRYLVGLLSFISMPNLLFSQVGITKMDRIDIHPKSILSIDGVYDSKSRGIMPPSISKYENLPLYDKNESDLFLDDSTMKGMLLYENTHATFYTYDGEKWNNENPKNNFKNNKSRFLADADDKQSVVCVLLGCGNHVALQFNAPIDGNNSYNNLNIKRENTSITYGLITYDFTNAKFVIEEPGIYEISISIPSKTGGAVSLTSGPRYQIRGYLQDENGIHKETKLTDFAPDYYGILGIGGDTNTGAYSSTQIRLKRGDYIIPRIDSPGATVSVVVTMTADSDQEIANNYPREIIFSKISD